MNGNKNDRGQSMRIHIDAISEQGETLAFEAMPEDFSVLGEIQKAGECEFLSPIKFRLHVIRIRHFVEISGTFDAVIRLTCCRCLKRFRLTMAHHFDLTYTNDSGEIAENSSASEKEPME